MIERTLVLIKPEGVQRALVGRIISILEDAGIKVIAMKMVRPDKKLIELHYPLDMEWAKNLWSNTKKGYEARGQKFTDTPLQVGRRVRNRLMRHLASGPVIALVAEGNDAVASVRKMVGVPSPNRADPSTIRGMFCTDSYERADEQDRITFSIVHASDSTKTAEREIKVWFRQPEITEYKRADEKLLY